RLAIFRTAARAVAARRRQVGILHWNRWCLRTRRARRRRIGAQIARRTLLLLAKRRTAFSHRPLRRTRRARPAGRRRRRTAVLRRADIGAAESLAGTARGAAGPR